jgi:hypothetical protein
MKPVKTLGLAVTAALMAMAFVGAGSAMAESTALCSSDPGTGATAVCPSGNLLTHVHEETLSGAKAKLLSSITVECSVLLLGDTLSSLANPLVIHAHLTYNECGSCAVEETSADALVTVLKLGHETSDVTIDAGVYVDCGTFLECEYDGEGQKGTGKGPLLSSETNGSVVFTNQVLHKTGGGFFCPKEAKLDIIITPLPNPVYITN